eukprot:7844425-Pyramimonas_sp.AAC.2
MLGSFRRYGDATPLFERSLVISEKVLGEAHPAVGTGFHNLAGLYRKTGRCDGAMRLAERSLAIRGKAHGEEHSPEKTRELSGEDEERSPQKGRAFLVEPLVGDGK